MKNYLACLFMVLSLNLSAQYFQHSYGWGPFNTAPALAYNLKHEFGLFGSFSSSTSGQTDYILLRTDSTGNFIDAHAYGSGGVESAQSILALPDSGFLLSGFSNGFAPNNDYNAYIIRTNFSGDTLWTRSIGSSVWDFIYSSSLLNDGNFIFSGFSNQSNNGLTAGWIFMLSPSGQLLLDRRIEIPGMNIYLNSILSSLDGSLYACGYSQSIATQKESGCLFRLNSSLDTIWSYFSDAQLGEARFNGLTKTYDCNLALCGYRIENGHSDKDIIAMAIDTNGYQIWSKIFSTSGDEYFNSISTRGDSVICAGTTNSFGGGQYDFYVAALDSMGNFLHGSTFGGAQDEIPLNLIPITNNGFATFGTTTSYGPGLQSMMLVTCDSLLNSANTLTVSVPSSAVSDKNLMIYPNPSTGHATIQFNRTCLSSKKEVTIFNLEGRQILKVDTSENQLLLKDLPSGYYLVTVSFYDGRIVTQKLIIETGF